MKHLREGKHYALRQDTSSRHHRGFRGFKRREVRSCSRRGSPASRVEIELVRDEPPAWIETARVNGQRVRQAQLDAPFGRDLIHSPAAPSTRTSSTSSSCSRSAI